MRPTLDLSSSRHDISARLNKDLDVLGSSPQSRQTQRGLARLGPRIDISANNSSGNLSLCCCLPEICLAACQKGLKVRFITAAALPLSKTGAELLFETISQCYERGSVIITSNLPFDEWTEIFGSERLTGALLDRLTHHVHILEMNGESFRLKQSQKRRNSPKTEPS